MRQRKILAFFVALCVLAFAGSARAASWEITYDGYLQENDTGWVLADTLFVVTNGNDTANISVMLDVYDKYGAEVATDVILKNGGMPLPIVGPNSFGWITLGMIVQRATKDPYNLPGAEKFVVKITTSGLSKVTPIVEVKQVIYHIDQEHPGEAIWQAGNIRTWAETCLGGLKGPGVTRVPKKMQW